jgi:deazaflavin-dependent oxidoreductase (nitroreductase family)
MSDEITDNVIAEFRANGGHVGSDLAGTPVILVHHIGARTGTERVTPLAYSSQADGRLVIAASNGGSPTHPGWYHNLTAHPTVEVELGTEAFTALAEELTGTAHAELWPKLVAASPALGEFQSRTARRIPLFALTRQHARAPRTRLR